MRRLKTFDFFGTRRIWFGLSLALILATLVSLALPGRGLQLGIDFTGGSLLEARFGRTDVTTGEVGAAVLPLGFGEPIIQRAVEDPQRFLVRTKAFDQAQRDAVEAALREKVGEFEVVRFEGIAGVIGAELTRNAFMAVTIASALILLYVTMRFEFRFGVAAVLALIHDVLVTIGVFSIFRLEVNSSFVAALLTVVGYSINDTIVIFDRIREHLREKYHGPAELGALVNRSVSECLSRTINTSATTFLAVGSVYVFGGRTTRDFALALIVGIIAGSYSTIFIASPIWAIWRRRSMETLADRGRDPEHDRGRPATKPAPEGRAAFADGAGGGGPAAGTGVATAGAGVATAGAADVRVPGGKAAPAVSGDGQPSREQARRQAQPKRKKRRR